MGDTIEDSSINRRMAMPIERLADKNIEKPSLDDRDYRVIRLSNKLEALLIHDADTDKASAALDVNIGSFSDADDMPGMAHAVEHALFMGTEKYPQENAYNEYLATHSGSSNAYTASTSTNFYFEVAAVNGPSSGKSSANAEPTGPAESRADSSLYGALDRFAQFFIKPLFLKDTLDRELRAVDSENKKNLQSDTWRLHQLNKSLSNPEHPWHHFSTGNFKTLHDEPLARGVQIRDAFINFYETHYSANRMKLVVLGRESLDTLEEWVEELFSLVENKNLPRLRWDDSHPFTKRELGMQVFAKPVCDVRSVDLYFPYPDEQDLFESQPGRYLSHLIGHEGPGSILALIKSKGWATGLGAGASSLCPGSAFFSISIRLTEDGLKHVPDVVEAVFHYIAVLKETPPQQWVFDELSTMSAVDFKFRQKAPASTTTSGLANVMQRPLPRDNLISGLSMLRKFDPENIKNGLSYLNPDNFRLTIVSQDHAAEWDQIEKWYGTEYRYEKIPAETIDRIRKAASANASQRPSDLHLPAINEFIPSRLEVERKFVAEPAKAPKLIRNDDRVRTWFKKDDQFWVPKASVRVLLRSPLVNSSARSLVLAVLYQALVQDSLNEYSYAAEVAGLDYSLSAINTGLYISLSGYNDKMSTLLEKVVSQMKELEVKPDRFRITKERLVRGYKNAQLQQPYYQVGSYSQNLCVETVWLHEQLAAELDVITEDDVRRYFPEVLSQLHIEVVAMGNLYREDALRFTDVVEAILQPKKLPPSQWPIKRSLIHPPGCDFVYKKQLKDQDNVNHCIEYLLFLGNAQDRVLRAKILLFAQIAEEPCFDQLRTKEQLGYVVFSGARLNQTWLGYRILIQSERTPEYLETRIDNFFTELGHGLSEMSESKFAKLKSSLINKRLEKLKNLDAEVSRFCTHILNEGYDFEQSLQDVHHLESLIKDDIVTFFDHYISTKSKQRAKISVHMVAKKNAVALIEAESPTDQIVHLSASLEKLFSAHNIQSDPNQLADRLKGVRISFDEPDPITEAVMSHLTQDVKLPTDQAQMIIQQGLLALGSSTLTTDTNESAASSVSKSVLIEDIHAWKASLHSDKGAHPVRPLKDFEDIEAKL